MTVKKLIVTETNLDGELKELAIENWEEFVSLIGPDALVSAKVCHLRKVGKSYGQIAAKLKLSKKQVRNRCVKCMPITGTL